jgi:hypothetical protein
MLKQEVIILWALVVQQIIDPSEFFRLVGDEFELLKLFEYTLSEEDFQLLGSFLDKLQQSDLEIFGGPNALKELVVLFIEYVRTLNIRKDIPINVAFLCTGLYMKAEIMLLFILKILGYKVGCMLNVDHQFDYNYIAIPLPENKNYIEKMQRYQITYNKHQEGIKNTKDNLYTLYEKEIINGYKTLTSFNDLYQHLKEKCYETKGIQLIVSIHHQEVIFQNGHETKDELNISLENINKKLNELNKKNMSTTKIAKFNGNNGKNVIHVVTTF